MATYIQPHLTLAEYCLSISSWLLDSNADYAKNLISLALAALDKDIDKCKQLIDTHDIDNKYVWEYYFKWEAQETH